MSKQVAYTPDFIHKYRLTPRRMFVAVAVVLLVVILGVVLKMVNNVGQGNGLVSAVAGGSNRPQGKAQTMESIGHARFDVLNVTEKAAFIRVAIDEFEHDSAEYQKLRDKLLYSPKGEPLAKTKWIQTVFLARWQKRLPSPTLGEYFRKKLEALCEAPEYALANKSEGFVPDQKTYDYFQRLATQVDTAKVAYADHLRLMEALARRIGEAPQADQKTIEAAILKLEDEMMMGAFEEAITGTTTHEGPAVNTSSPHPHHLSPSPEETKSSIDRAYETIVKPNAPSEPR